MINTANNFSVVLAEGINSTDTSVDVVDATGAPSTDFMLTIGSEIVKVTNVAGNTLTIARKQEGTANVPHTVGDTADNRWTAGTLSGYLEDTYLHKETLYFASNDTFTKANYANLKAIKVKAVGGGGGGGGAAITAPSEAASAGGGGGGGMAEKFILASALGTSETITIGSGGNGGAAGANNGVAGGTTSFGAHLTASGGGFGEGATNGNTTLSRFGGLGGTGASGDINLKGSDGLNGLRFTTDCVEGGGGGGTPLGGPVRANATTNGGNGANGYLYGGGGAGGHNRAFQLTARSGGNGANGIVIVEILR